MKIRSITYFADTGFPFEEARIAAAGKFLAEARATFEGGGFETQYTRLALPPLARTFGNAHLTQAVKYAQDLEAMCFVHGIDFASIGVAKPDDPPAFYEIIPEALGATQNIFGAAVIASPIYGVSLAAIKRAAKIIQRCSTISQDGFGNLRFAALANVESGVPYFPAAYHEGGAAMFAVAVEAADLAVAACAGAGSLAEARSRLVESVEEQAKKVVGLAKKIGGSRSVRFGGIDFSLAPFPSPDKSIGAAMEALGAPLGASGSLTAAAFLAEALDRADYPATGFSGLFLPVLEDNVLAARAAEGALTITDLLLYSAVCGTGLDTVPLAGDISPDELAAILLDVATLAMRLNKPLTARLMPMPGKQAGDDVTFEFKFFADGKVLAHRAKPLTGPLGGEDSFDLARRAR